MSDEEPAKAQATIDKRVEQYIAIREKLKVMDERHKQEREELVATQNLLSGWMIQFLEKTGAESVKTKHGTCYTSIRHTASLADPDQFMKYVIATGAFDLLDRRANATACRDFAEAKGSLPPGVNLNSLLTIGVRKK